MNFQLETPEQVAERLAAASTQQVSEGKTFDGQGKPIVSSIENKKNEITLKDLNLSEYKDKTTQDIVALGDVDAMYFSHLFDEFARPVDCISSDNVNVGVFVPLGKSRKTEDILQEIDLAGLRPLNLQESLAYLIKNSDMFKPGQPLIALGSRISTESEGESMFPMLGADVDKKVLGARSDFAEDWGKEFSFLVAVK